MTESALPEPVLPEPLLAVHDLEVAFRGPARLADLAGSARKVKAIDGVTLSVARGETLGIVGESGCGKTTLGRSITRLAPATGGRILFEGKDIATLTKAGLAAFRRRVQMIFQDPKASLNPLMTIGETLAETLRVHGSCPRADIPARVASLLETVGLGPELAARRPAALSGGQCQRVGIARALAVEPSLIVADESVSALDVSVQAQIVNLLTALQREQNLALVFISHDLNIVRYFCTRICVMYLGRIVEEGPCEEVLSSPRHPYTRALVAANPHRGTPFAPALAGEPPSPLALPPGCRFHPRCSEALEQCRTGAPPQLLPVSRCGVACHLYSGDGATAGISGKISNACISGVEI